MSRLFTFFQDADTAFGVFFPKYYLLAVYKDFQGAELAKAKLAETGRLDGDVIAATGDEVVAFADEHLSKDGLWGLMMTQVSRAIGTEAEYADRDLAAAKNGAAFLAVHCLTEEAKVEVWKVLEPTRPTAARYYSAGGIEHMVGEV